MKGIIKKDLYLLKANLKSLKFLFVIFIAFMLLNNSYEITYMLPFISFMLFTSSFSYDEYYNWNAYALTLPIKREDIIKSKYLISIGIIFVSSIIGVLFTAIIFTIKGDFSIDSLLITLLECLCALSFIVSIMYPIFLKFGAEKGRIALFVVTFIIVLGIVLMVKMLENTPIIGFFKQLESIILYIIPIIVCIALFISYQISKKIFLKKEF